MYGRSNTMSDGTNRVRFGLELTAISRPPLCAPLIITTSLPSTALGKTCTLILLPDFRATMSPNISNANVVWCPGGQGCASRNRSLGPVYSARADDSPPHANTQATASAMTAR